MLKRGIEHNPIETLAQLHVPRTAYLGALNVAQLLLCFPTRGHIALLLHRTSLSVFYLYVHVDYLKQLKVETLCICGHIFLCSVLIDLVLFCSFCVLIACVVNVELISTAAPVDLLSFLRVLILRKSFLSVLNVYIIVFADTFTS